MIGLILLLFVESCKLLIWMFKAVFRLGYWLILGTIWVTVKVLIPATIAAGAALIVLITLIVRAVTESRRQRAVTADQQRASLIPVVPTQTRASAEQDSAPQVVERAIGAHYAPAVVPASATYATTVPMPVTAAAVHGQEGSAPRLGAIVTEQWPPPAPRAATPMSAPVATIIPMAVALVDAPPPVPAPEGEDIRADDGVSKQWPPPAPRLLPDPVSVPPATPTTARLELAPHREARGPRPVLAITGFVVAMLSVIVLFSLVASVAAPLPGIAGLVLGVVGLTRARDTGRGKHFSWWAVSVAAFTLLAWCGLVLIGMANAGVI